MTVTGDSDFGESVADRRGPGGPPRDGEGDAPTIENITSISLSAENKARLGKIIGFIDMRLKFSR